MCKETDLQCVKAEALRFLDMPIERAMIVSHPFTNSMFFPFFDEKSGETKFECLEPGSTAYKKWRLLQENAINSSKNVFIIFMMIEKAFKFPFFKNVKNHLSKKDFAQIFADAWISVENPNSNEYITREECIECFKLCDQADLMTKEELSTLDALPERCMIYRGVTTYNLDDYEALSWTLSEEKAGWFAKRPPFGKGLVFRASVDKSDILAYFQRRQEDEIIVDHSTLKNIEIHASFGLDSEDLSFVEDIL